MACSDLQTTGEEDGNRGLSFHGLRTAAALISDLIPGEWLGAG